MGEPGRRLVDEDPRTDAQKERANWAAHGYRKLYQPRSVRRFGLVFSLLLAGLLLTIFWLAAHGRFLF